MASRATREPAAPAETAKAVSIDPRRGRQLSLQPGVRLEAAADRLVVRTLAGELTLDRGTPGLLAAVAALEAGSTTADQLADTVLDLDGPEVLPRLYVLLARLTRLGLVAQHVTDGDELVLTMRPTGAVPAAERERLTPARSLLLSRFSLLRREGSSWLLEAPLGHHQVVLHDERALRLVASLKEAQRADARPLPELGAASTLASLQALWDAGALTEVLAGEPSEDADPALALWAPHDLFFHVRSRFGRHAGPFGAGFRHIDRFDPLPAVRPGARGAGVELPRPDLEAVAARDPSLTEAIEGRHSERAMVAPLSLAELGEFLYRVGRVRSLETLSVRSLDGRTAELEVSSRPYPSGGRSYELEIYLSLRHCEGVAPGLYHYDPLGHLLHLVRPQDELVDGLLRYSTIAAPGDVPAAVIHLAARFGRVSWKYDAMAYATIMKHVGVLYQSMYLVAYAMGLAACALGSGDSDLFAAAAGTDYLTETSVGDFMLSGSSPHQAQAGGSEVTGDH